MDGEQLAKIAMLCDNGYMSSAHDADDFPPTPQGSVFRSQAERILSKFGTNSDVVRALKAIGISRSLSNVGRWRKAGRIPSTVMDEVLRAGYYRKIEFTFEDLDPRPRP